MPGVSFTVVTLLVILTIIVTPSNQTASPIITEYVAMVPEVDIKLFPSQPITNQTVVKWIKVTYPSGVSNANDVQISYINSSVDEIGAWYELDTDIGIYNTAKIHGDSLYAFVNHNHLNTTVHLCCTDTLSIWSKKNGSRRDLNLDQIVQAAIPGSNHATHTFDIKQIGDKTFIFAMVDYVEARLGGPDNTPMHSDAIVAFDAADGSILKTADGRNYFDIYEVAGYNSKTEADVFKIQYFNNTSPSRFGTAGEWHGNGLATFVTRDGTSLLAITHKVSMRLLSLSRHMTTRRDTVAGRSSSGSEPRTKPLKWELTLTTLASKRTTR